HDAVRLVALQRSIIGEPEPLWRRPNVLHVIAIACLPANISRIMPIQIPAWIEFHRRTRSARLTGLGRSRRSKRAQRALHVLPQWHRPHGVSVSAAIHRRVVRTTIGYTRNNFALCGCRLCCARQRLRSQWARSLLVRRLLRDRRLLPPNPLAG